MKRAATLLAMALLAGCAKVQPPAPFKVDPATAAIVTGTMTLDGQAPPAPPVDMSEDPACVEAHKKGRFDGPVEHWGPRRVPVSITGRART